MLTSSVWDDMTRVVKEDGTATANCNYCKRSFNASGTHGPSHLRRHIDTCPTHRYRDIKSFCISRGGSTSETVGNKNQIGLRKCTATFEEIREAICVYCVWWTSVQCCRGRRV